MSIRFAPRGVITSGRLVGQIVGDSVLCMRCDHPYNPKDADRCPVCGCRMTHPVAQQGVGRQDSSGKWHITSIDDGE